MLQDAHRSSGRAAEQQRGSEVIQRVGVGKALFAGRLQAPAEALAGRRTARPAQRRQQQRLLPLERREAPDVPQPALTPRIVLVIVVPMIFIKMCCGWR